MAEGMSRGEIRTMLAAVKLARGVLANDSIDNKLSEPLEKLMHRLILAGNITHQDIDVIDTVCDSALNRFEDRQFKALRSQVEREIADAEDAQIKKTHHGAAPVVDPTPTPVPPPARRPSVPRVQTTDPKKKYTPRPRGDWSRVYDQFYEQVETSMYVPDPRNKNLNLSRKPYTVSEEVDMFLSWVGADREYRKFFTENRDMVLLKGLRIWRDRFDLAYLVVPKLKAEIDRYFRTHFPTVNRTR